MIATLLRLIRSLCQRGLERLDPVAETPTIPPPAPLPVGHSLRVTTDNLDECMAALRALRERRALLVGMTRKYPVELLFGGNRVVVDCAADIDSVIGILSERVRACTDAPINSWRGGQA